MTVRTVGIGSSVPINSTAKISSAFNVQSNVMRIVAKGKNAHVAINTGTAATNEDFFITAGEEETISITKGSQAVVSITNGSTTILEAPEGTQMPFIIGDYVTLDTANDTNYTTLINDTKVVGKSRSAGVGGDFEEKITVEANTAGVSTAFTPTGNATLFMSNKVSVISPNSDANSVVQIQQVQTTGSA